MKATCRSAWLGLCLALGCCVPGAAEADTVRLDFALTVRDTLGDLRDLFGVPVAVGDVVNGRLTYDTSAADTDPNSRSGFYRSQGLLELAVGSGLSMPLDSISTADENFSPFPNMDDVFTAFAATDFPTFLSLTAEIGFTGGGRVGDALPRTAAEFLAAFAAGGLRLIGLKEGIDPPFDRGTHELAGIVRLLPDAPQPVPEPATLLLCAGGAAWILRRRLGVRR